jgi:hypothetical protein
LHYQAPKYLLDVAREHVDVIGELRAIVAEHPYRDRA